MTLDRYLEILERDTHRIADIVRAEDAHAAVAACPGWTLGDLVFHVGVVHQTWNWIAREQIQQRSPDDGPSIVDPPDSELADWLLAGLDQLLPVLRTADPTAPVWSWTTQHNMAFIQRRMPHETSIHRWDAEAVVHASAPIDTDLAVDGIDEFFFLAASEPVNDAARIGLAPTDSKGRWTASVVDGRLSLSSQQPDERAVLMGTASDLLLVLWRRLPMSAIAVSGDQAAAAHLLTLANLD